MSSRRPVADQLPSFDARVKSEPRVSFSSSQTGSPGDFNQGRGLVPFEKVDDIMVRVHTTAKVALVGLAFLGFASLLGMGYLVYENTKLKKSQKATEALLAKMEHELESSEDRVAVAVKDAMTRPGFLDSMASVTFQRMLQVHDAQRKAHEEAAKSWDAKNQGTPPEGSCPVAQNKAVPEPEEDFGPEEEEDEPRLEKRSSCYGSETVTEPEEDFGPEEEEWPEHQNKEVMAAAEDIMRTMDNKAKEAIVMASAAEMIRSMDPQTQMNMARLAAQIAGEDPEQVVDILAETGFIEPPRVPSFSAEVLSDEEPSSPVKSPVQSSPIQSKGPSPVQSKSPSPVKSKSPSPVKPKAKPRGKKGKSKKNQ